MWGNGCFCGKKCCESSPHNALIDKINPQVSFKVITSCITIPVFLDGFCTFSYIDVSKEFLKLIRQKPDQKKITKLGHT